MASPHAVAITLSAADRATLEGWTRRRKTAQGLAMRARIVLACAAAGATNGAVAAALGVSRPTVAPGASGLPSVVTTLERTPANATHWSTRSLAQAVGLSQSAVVRIWHAFALQPHRSETFQLSRDPLFVDKVRDIGGLYMNPPDRALVLCVDEKPQIRAIEGTAPVQPMRPGQVERHTHDYIRHGTTDLFAALDVKTGTVIGTCRQRHRAVEFRACLDQIDRRVPPDLDVHLVLDNASTHKAPLIQQWLLKRPRYHLHFTPTSGSWLNLVEAWFALLNARQLRRGKFRSTRSLEQAIRRYIATTNQNPKPFIWTKTADDILASIQRFCQRTSNSAQ